MARARIDKHSEREAERRRGAHLGVLVRILLGACGDHEHGVVVAHLEGTRRLLERSRLVEHAHALGTPRIVENAIGRHPVGDAHARRTSAAGNCCCGASELRRGEQARCGRRREPHGHVQHWDLIDGVEDFGEV